MRKRMLWSICLILALAPMTAFGQASDATSIHMQKPNLVGGELGGRAILYSINYERFVSPRVGIGAGFMGFGVSEGGVFLIPLYVSFTPVGNVHSLYLSAGYTWAAVSNWNEVRSDGYGTAVLGYLYHSENGFFVRPGITLNFRPETNDGGGGFFMLPGVALGGSF